MSGVYVHIPFCRQSCIYCNFYFKNGNREADTLVNALLKEIDLRAGQMPEKLETLYFGGGTPSFISPGLIEQIIVKLHTLTDHSQLGEVTLEANPDDIRPGNLERWKQMGINRLSIGVQSFYDHHLKWMNRAHNAEEADTAIRTARTLGFEVSIDLIFGIPGSTAEEWSGNLEKAMAYDIQHLSCYGLTLEENTPWKKLVSTRNYPVPNDDLASEQFMFAEQLLEKNGWIHYEISNYSRPRKMAKHNTAYWQGKPYIGLGPSAHSYDGRSRSWNIADLNAYVKSLDNGILTEERELLGQSEKHNEYIMTGLRTMWGIDIRRVSEFGFGMADFREKVNRYIAEGKMQKQNDILTLTTEGKLYADAIAASLFV